jgi:hypothetical protein
MAEDRSWMYSGWDKGGKYTDEWMDKATTFLDHAFSRTQIVWCPCSRCHNSKCLEGKRTIAIHLCRNGFVLGYEVRTFHSKSGTKVVAEDEHDCDVRDIDRLDEMLEAIQAEVTEDPTTMEVEVFLKLLRSSTSSGLTPHVSQIHLNNEAMENDLRTMKDVLAVEQENHRVTRESVNTFNA